VLACSAIEGSVVLLAGLVVGVVLGLGLATIMAPYSSQVLMALGAVMAGPGAIEGRAIVRLILLLLAVYGLALALLLMVRLFQRQSLSAGWREDE
jgi:hypothetical protein